METDNLILGLKQYDMNGQPFVACHYIRTQTKHVVHNERQPHTNKVITTEQDIFAQMNTIPATEVLKYVNYYSFYAFEDQYNRVVLKDYDLDSDEEFQNIMNNYKASDGIFAFTFKDSNGNRNFEYMSYVNKSMLNIAKGDAITMEIRDNLNSQGANRFLVKYDIYKKSKKCKLTVLFMALKF